MDVECNRLSVLHGKSIALDMQHRYVPFSSLFIIHETRVRGFHLFQPIAPPVPVDGPWQDGISSDGVFDNESDSFRHDMPAGGSDNEHFSGPIQFQCQSTMRATPSGEQAEDGGDGICVLGVGHRYHRHHPRCNSRVELMESMSNGGHELGWDCRGEHTEICLLYRH